MIAVLSGCASEFVCVEVEVETESGCIIANEVMIETKDSNIEMRISGGQFCSLSDADVCPLNSEEGKERKTRTMAAKPPLSTKRFLHERRR